MGMGMGMGMGTDLEGLHSTKFGCTLWILEFGVWSLEFATPIEFQDFVQQCKLERPRL
jgi:hypothetical protein